MGRWLQPLGGAIVAFVGATQKSLRGEPHVSQSLLCPLLDVLRSMALCLARDQADQCLLQNPSLGDAVGVNSKEAHASLGPEVADDGWLDARLDEAQEEVAGEHLTLLAKQQEMWAQGLTARQLVTESSLAQLEDAREEGLELRVLNNLWRPATLESIMFALCNLP